MPEPENATTRGGDAPTCLLLVLPLVIHDVEGALWLDTQACNGLRLWLEHFDRVILCQPSAATAAPPPGTSNVRALLPAARLDIVTLPRAYTPLRFAKALPGASRLLRGMIDRATHLQFAIGGAFGDWGAVGALIAARRGREAAVWTDRVESQVMRAHARRTRGPRRAYRLLTAWLAQVLERGVIRRSALGLFHGMDTFKAYAPYSRAPHVVHDIHLSGDMRISPDALAAKAARPPGAPLTILYGGRVHPDKGPLHWIDALIRVAAAGIAFEATWHGDGPDLDAARARVAAAGLDGRIRFPGAIQDRDALMRAFRDGDLFLFCHQTPESPRCLVEALLSGMPIVGYDGDYPRDLTAAHGGSVLTRRRPDALADAVIALARDRARLGDLCRQAAAAGHDLTDSAVFRHRAELIKTLRPA